MAETAIVSPQETIIGRYYMVPCAVFKKSYAAVYWRDDGATIPVYGPLHNDAEYLSVGYDHYHFDWRFFRKGEMGIYENRKSPLTGFILNADHVSHIVYEKRRCARIMPHFPKVAGDYDRERFGKLEKGFEDRKICTHKMICPHRGLNLKGLPIENGVVTCPGHGLCWDTTTGKLVPRYSEVSDNA